MAIRDSSGQQYLSFAEGVDNTTAIGAPELKGTLSEALNTDLVDDALAKKRGGYTAKSTWGTRNIRGGLEYKNPNGTREILVYGESSTLTGTSGTLGKFTGTATPTTLQSGLKDGNKPSILQLKSLAFIFDGVNNLLYDGTSVRSVGIPEPTVAPTFITNLAGDLVTSGSYLFAYSYYNTSTGAESNLSPPSSIMTAGATASQAGITISVVAGNSTYADKIRIYRTVSGGNVFFREEEISISSTTYDSTTLDGGLGTEAELDNSRLTEAPGFAIVQDNRIFAGGFATNPNRIQYSKIGISGPMPESFQADDFVDCNLNDGDKIIGIGKARESAIVIKERSVGRLIRVESLSSGLERQGSQKYIYEEISSETTGLSHHTIVSIDNICLWMGRDDVYGTDGVQIFRFGKRIRKTIKALDFSQAHKWSSIVKTDTQQVIFSCTQTGKLECDFQLVGHYRNFPKLAWTFYSAGPTTTTHPGLVVGSFFQVTDSQVKKFYFGGASANGNIYQMDIGDADDTYGIYWSVKLPHDGGGNPNTIKTFHSYYLLVAGGGVSPNNTIVNTWEENTNETTILSTTSSITQGATTWSGGNWGSFNWSSVSFQPLRFYPHRKAYFGRYGMQNTYANQPIAIRALTAVYQVSPIHR